jgi:hypothetical protein
VVFFVGEFQERKMAIDPRAWDTNVEGILEIALKFGESLFEGFW